MVCILYPSKSFVLDHSESVDINIEKLKKKKISVFVKNWFLPYGRGGVGQKVTDMSATIRFFDASLIFCVHSLTEFPKYFALHLIADFHIPTHLKGYASMFYFG